MSFLQFLNVMNSDLSKLHINIKSKNGLYLLLEKLHEE